MAQIKTVGTDNSASLKEPKRKRNKKMWENDSRTTFVLLDIMVLFEKKQKKTNKKQKSSPKTNKHSWLTKRTL